MRRLLLLPLAVAALALALASSARADTKTIQITRAGFVPATTSVAVGDTVTWHNADTVNHQVVANDGSFASPVLKPGETYSATFSKQGQVTDLDAAAQPVGRPQLAAVRREDGEAGERRQHRHQRRLSVRRLADDPDDLHRAVDDRDESARDGLRQAAARPRPQRPCLHREGDLGHLVRGPLRPRPASSRHVDELVQRAEGLPRLRAARAVPPRRAAEALVRGGDIASTSRLVAVLHR